jgi:hypothetical protein
LPCRLGFHPRGFSPIESCSMPPLIVEAVDHCGSPPVTPRTYRNPSVSPKVRTGSRHLANPEEPSRDSRFKLVFDALGLRGEGWPGGCPRVHVV